MTTIIINSDASFGAATRALNDIYMANKYCTVKVQTGRQRTVTQNNAIHKFCRLIADACNAAGFEYQIKSLLTGDYIEMPWTMERVKAAIWSEVQLAMYPEKKGTSALNTDEVSEVANVIIRHLAEKRGLNIPFPSKEELDGYKERQR